MYTLDAIVKTRDGTGLVGFLADDGERTGAYVSVKLDSRDNIIDKVNELLGELTNLNASLNQSQDIVLIDDFSFEDEIKNL